MSTYTPPAGGIAQELLCFTVADPTNTLPEEVAFCLDARGITVVRASNEQVYFSWPWTVATQFGAAKQSTDPTDMELFHITIAEIGQFIFECEDGVMVKSAFQKSMLGDVGSMPTSRAASTSSDPNKKGIMRRGSQEYNTVMGQYQGAITEAIGTQDRTSTLMHITSRDRLRRASLETFPEDQATEQAMLKTLHAQPGKSNDKIRRESMDAIAAAKNGTAPAAASAQQQGKMRHGSMEYKQVMGQYQSAIGSTVSTNDKQTTMMHIKSRDNMRRASLEAAGMGSGPEQKDLTSLHAHLGDGKAVEKVRKASIVDAAAAHGKMRRGSQEYTATMTQYQEAIGSSTSAQTTLLHIKTRDQIRRASLEAFPEDANTESSLLQSLHELGPCSRIGAGGPFKITLRVAGACNLDAAGSAAPTVVPYAIVEVGSDSGRTVSFKGGNRPQWNHKFEFEQASQSGDVRVTIADQANKDRILGTIIVPLDGKWQAPVEAQPAGGKPKKARRLSTVSEWHSLQGPHKDGVAASGAIKLQLLCTCDSNAMPVAAGGAGGAGAAASAGAAGDGLVTNGSAVRHGSVEYKTVMTQYHDAIGDAVKGGDHQTAMMHIKTRDSVRRASLLTSEGGQSTEVS
jgi:hypothetical protein